MVAQPNYGLSTDVTLGGNSPSDIISPSEKAIKTYVDNSSGLPSQSGNNGKFLTTNGTAASWASVPTEIPSQSGNSGKFLTTNGSSVSWATVGSSLPSQTGNSGKFLTTDGSTASWADTTKVTFRDWSVA